MCVLVDRGRAIRIVDVSVQLKNEWTDSHHFREMKKGLNVVFEPRIKKKYKEIDT